MKFIIILLSLSSTLPGPAQNGYREGDRVTDFEIKKLLNGSVPAAHLTTLKKQITIIDFFGTWCAPCIKAIPELTNFQSKYKEEIQILLISTEPENALLGFIKKYKPFAFPLAADTDESISKLFQPPSYPYTVILDNNLKIIRITHAIDLTEAVLENLIRDRKKNTAFTMEERPIENKILINETNPVITGSVLQLSQALIYAAKTNTISDSLTGTLKQLPFNSLQIQLKSDDEKKAFWINIYNAFTNIALHQNPSLYKHRNKFFKAKTIGIANHSFSLDQIEHDILRRSKIKWSLGYLNKLFPKAIEKKLRVQKADWRIHFALNCGAKSCPPIAFYQPDQINKQLDLSARNYLISECTWNKQKTRLAVPVLFSWFRKDFGGKKNILPILKKYGIIAENDQPKIYFRKYNWDLYLENYLN
jgi:thiol-disulfide isomerase/thioredoxin